MTHHRADLTAGPNSRVSPLLAPSSTANGEQSAAARKCTCNPCSRRGRRLLHGTWTWNAYGRRYASVSFLFLLRFRILRFQPGPCSGFVVLKACVLIAAACHMHLHLRVIFPSHSMSGVIDIEDIERNRMDAANAKQKGIKENKWIGTVLERNDQSVDFGNQPSRSGHVSQIGSISPLRVPVLF
ncbi:hypothetical protein A7U60_g4109 [Sanghuangporus baumii]|uniref:Uncharacterized protein n=1 Tax=Sanghuangporus baumii TaxID=108892 RepID=A0A9Q5N9F2_SANBA|nr:hypothetical protein A7U60_g4109 [Sanghuangporus baumii]